MDIHIERLPQGSADFAVCYEDRQYGKDPYELVGAVVPIGPGTCEIRNVLGEIRPGLLGSMRQRLLHLGYASATIKVLRGQPVLSLFGEPVGRTKLFDYYRVDL